MKPYFTLLLLFFQFGLFAQYSFFHHFQETWRFVHGIEISDHVEFFTSNLDRVLYRNTLGDDGAILKTDSLEQDSTQYIGELFLRKDGTYLSFGQKRNDSTLKAVYILDFDQGEIVNEYTYGKISETMFDNTLRDVYRLENGEFLLSSTQSETGTPSSLGNLVCFDSDGNIIWDKVYTIATPYYHIDHINGVAVHLESYYFSLMTSWDSPTVMGEKDYENNLVKIDKDGNEVWRVNMATLNTGIDRADSMFFIHKVFTLPNGNIACFSKIETKFYNGKRTFFLEFSPQGELLKTKEVFIKNKIEARYSYQYEDGSLFMTGSAENEEGWFMELFAVKFNIDYGIDWYKEYGYFGSNESLSESYGINSNKGVTMVGYYLNYQELQFEPFIVHTDCRGNTTWDYSACNINDSGEELLVFPNPSNGLFSFHLPQSNEDMSFTLNVYDVLGRRVFQKEYTNPVFSVDLQSCASGTYTYVLNSNKGESYQGKLVVY